MNDFKIKMLLSVLSGLIFSFIFILLALILPINESKDMPQMVQKPKGRLAEISHAFKNR